jgi:hypothetical protein
MLQQCSTSQVIASTYQCLCHWRPLILVPVSPNRFTTPKGKRQRGGIELLRVPMPRELKSRLSTSPAHSGITAKILTKTSVDVLQFPVLCKPMPRRSSAHPSA